MNLIKVFLLSLIISNLAFSKVDLKKINNLVEKSHDHLLEEQVQEKEQFWNYPSTLGEMYLSQYYLVLRWLKEDVSNFDTELLRQKLIKRQLPDGSWAAIIDPNHKIGDIYPTFFNYWFLKVLNKSEDKKRLQKAKNYILSVGGLEQAPLFAKIFLALFNQYDWSVVPNIPVWFFNHKSAFHEKQMGQWIGPHLLPISYLKNNGVSKDLGKLFNVSELFVTQTKMNPPVLNIKNNDKLIDLMISRQRGFGSWGGYTLSTMLTLMSFDHQSSHIGVVKNYPIIKKRALEYVKTMYIDSKGKSHYEGAACDGRYWDTALIGLSLVESGYSIKNLKSSTKFLSIVQNKNGGFGFGKDFEMEPDTDDTSMIVRLLHKTGEHKEKVKKAEKWLLSMQNNNGGWGAFDHNNNPKPLINALAGKFSNSADLFDEASADITAHVLEALAELGHTRKNSQAVKRGLNYLRFNKKNGLWKGRWGVNYIYGTTAVINALAKLGFTKDSPILKKASQWLLSIQNKDGGFGETTFSDKFPELAGKGISTPSQTAWALMALLDLYPVNHPSITKAVKYLENTFDEKETWSDPSPVGTGHPIIVYMNYPSYPKAFPLMALGKYLHKKSQ